MSQTINEICQKITNHTWIPGDLFNLVPKIEQLQAESDKLKQYAKHKENCDYLHIYHIPDCPRCGSKRTRWRDGVGFECTKSCLDCPEHSWIPEEVRGKCTCGLDQVLKE